VPPSGHYSLRRRLIVGVVLAACLVWTILGFTIYRSVLGASSLEFDERLAQQAQVILLYADHEYAETSSVVPQSSDSGPPRDFPEVVYQIWSLDGRPVYRSAGAPEVPLMDLATQGFRDVALPVGDWRAFAMRSVSNPLVVEVAEPAEHRRLIARRVLQAVMLPLLLALPILAFLIYLLTQAALRPIQKFADAIAQRQSGDLQPLDTHTMPTETLALGEALNSLFVRHGDALSRESRFTADAAHEIRTPLAAVRAQAQVAQRATSPQQSAAALTKLIAGVDRANRLVSQLLSLTRLEHASDLAETPRRALAGVVEAVTNDLTELSTIHGVRINCGALPDIAVADQEIYLLLRNLIDNAIRHSSPGGQVRVTAGADAHGLELIVSDDGPGIAPELRARVLERFYRHDAHYDGSGLGLAMVARIVKLLQGSLNLESTPGTGGLAVRIRVPLPK
jgi:two-component system, OmpR family, sensor histidine kinase QseC